MAVMGALAVAVCLLCLPCVWAQLPDFLHIDCGSPTEYTDEFGIIWRTDDAYVSTGAVGLSAYTSSQPALLNLRYFRNSRGKNCYSLPTTPEQTYMLRAEFTNGNYDGAGDVGPLHPSFRIAIDSTVVENVTISRGINFNHIREVTFLAWRNETSLCFLRDLTNSTPFISSIALRLVDSLPSYILQQISKNQSVSTMSRVFFNDSTNVVMYPGDPHDRLWFASDGVTTNAYPLSALGTGLISDASLGYNFVNNSTIINTLFPDPEVGSNVPQNAIRSAITTSGNLSIPYHSNSTFDAFILGYYVELDKSVNATDRPFYITASKNGPLTPSLIDVRSATGSALSLFTSSHSNFTIGPDSMFLMYPGDTRTNRSKGPMISALEVFKVGTAAVPPTNDGDWTGIAVVKADMGLTSWRGDPCLPVPHDWLTCHSDDEFSEATVLEILLSGYNLTGSISSAFAGLGHITSLKLDNNSLSGPIPDLKALKNLTTLHLQNNNLSGPLPSWLASLPLQELFVQNNNLSGTIPGEFTTKNWNFLYSGNPQLIVGEAPAKKKKTNIGALIGEITAAIVVIGAIVGIIAYCCCCPRRARKDLETAQGVHVANPTAKTKPNEDYGIKGLG